MSDYSTDKEKDKKKKNITIKKTKSSIMQDISKCVDAASGLHWTILGDKNLDKKIVKSILAEANNNNSGDVECVVMINKKRISAQEKRAIKKADIILVIYEIGMESDTNDKVSSIKKIDNLAVKMYKVYTCGVICAFMVRKEVQ